MAYQLGTDVTVYDAWYDINGFHCVFEDNLGYTKRISDDKEFFATEKIKFIRGILVMDGRYENSDIVFSAPKIVITGEVAIENEDKNSITFENSSVNFDEATWYDDPIWQGKLAFSGESKLNLTSESNKTLIICDSISGTITLELDDSFVSGSTFSIQANSANNLIINNAEGYEVVPTTDGTTTTYTVKYIKEVQKISNENETYRLKDTVARERLITVDEKIDEFFHEVKELNDTVNNSESGLDTKLEKRMISNCILKTPVSVPISSLNGGILFRDRGSFQIVPYSMGKTEIESMSEVSYSGEDGKFLVFTSIDSGVIFVSPKDCSSGEDVSFDTDWKIFYLDQSGVTPDEDMILGYDKDVGLLGGYSYPIAEVTAKDNKIVSIDSIFRHCSYIDSHIIVYNGLKALLPKGRYEDGSLRTWEVGSSLSTIRVSGTKSLSYFAIGESGQFAISDEISSGNTYYDREANVFYLNKEDRGGNYVPIGTFACVDGHITEFHPKSAIKLAEEGETAVQPTDVPVKDVQAYGTSIVKDGVANIPLANTNNLPGLVRTSSDQGITMNGPYLRIVQATTTQIEAKTSDRLPITPGNLDYAVKVGVTTNTITLTDTEKANACKWFGAEEKTKIQALNATDSIILSDGYIYNGGEQTALTIAFPTYADVSFLCEIDFTSGATATTLTYPQSGIIWLGDDISNNVFIAVAGKRYTIMCAYDGVNYRFVVKGV